MVSEITKAQINELKGYVDSCADFYESGAESVPWSMMEAIQKRVEAIALGIREPVGP